MRTVTLFIAMSLDGYIADRTGGVSWLGGQDPEKEDGDSYSDFIKGIDTVIMGWNTYHQVATELSPGTWVYEGLTSYVMTHREHSDTEDIRFVNEDVCRLVRTLKEQKGKGIWICGGASIVGQLMKEDLIDRYDISVIPTILGDGIRLFEKMDKALNLKLLRTQSCNGITELLYERKI